MIGIITYPKAAERRATEWEVVTDSSGQVIQARLIMHISGSDWLSANLAELLHDETLDNMTALLGPEPSEDDEREGVRAAEVDREVDRRADRARGW
jgi:hypothetical protein